MLDDTGITFSWLGAYGLAGLLGFFGGKAIDKVLAVTLKRCLLGTRSKKKTKTVSVDREAQLELMREVAEKNKLKMTFFGLGKGIKNKA